MAVAVVPGPSAKSHLVLYSSTSKHARRYRAIVGASDLHDRKSFVKKKPLQLVDKLDILVRSVNRGRWQGVGERGTNENIMQM